MTGGKLTIPTLGQSAKVSRTKSNTSRSEQLPTKRIVMNGVLEV